MSVTHETTLLALSEQLKRKAISSLEATELCLARIEATASQNAYLHVAADAARASARQSDARRAKGNAKGELDGVPIALKDILCTTDMPTTCASKILEGFVAPYDATVVRLLRAQGAVLLGKLNMDEFAMGSSNEHSAYGAVKNPWDETRVPGGSSGGSAAAVAAGSAFAALGTDTGGSIRQPAAMTGTVGLKPTYGAVSRYGAIAYASSLDQIGPMTKDVADCAALFAAIAGHDPKDATSHHAAWPDHRNMVAGGVQGLKIGVPKEYFRAGTDQGVSDAVHGALKAFERLGATLVDVTLPHTEQGIDTYYVLAPAEASSNLSRYDGVRYGLREDGDKSLNEMYTHTRSKGFGPEVKRRILLGAWVLSAGHMDAYYRQAQKNRRLVRHDFDQAFQEVDVLVTPCVPSTAFSLGDRSSDPMKMYLADIFTVTANLAGLCGISLPCGFDKENLPIGMQVLGRPFDDAKVLQVAYAYEQAHDWHTRRAP